MANTIAKPGRKPAPSRRQPIPERDTERSQRKEVSVPIAEIDYAAAMQEVYGKRVDVIDKKLGLHSSLTKQPRVSTGLLCTDLMLGNGFVPGFNVYLGQEQSAKSTACMHALWSSLQRPISLRKYFDVEGAIDRRYTGNILQTDSWGDVFGDKGRNGWIKRPRCYYSDSNIIETIFRDMHRAAAFMPDKVFREDLGQWYLRFDRSTEHRNLVKELVGKGVVQSPDKALFTSTGAYWCSVGDDDSPQAMFFLDSLPMLITEKVDEEEVSGNALGILASHLTRYLPLVSGKLRSKGIVMLAVNQIRDNMMAGPGAPPWREPAGQAVKFTSSSRTMWNSCVPRDDFPRHQENKGLCSEPSVEFENTLDFYAFKSVTNIKNKYGQPFRKTTGRVWIKDGEGEPRGFDPVYDVYRFLCNVGAIACPQTENGRKKFRIDLKPIKDVDWTWKSFKTLVVGQYDNNKRLLHKAQELGAPNFRLRDYCIKLLNSGRTEDMLTQVARTQNSSKGVDLEAKDEETEE